MDGLTYRDVLEARLKGLCAKLKNLEPGTKEYEEVSEEVKKAYEECVKYNDDIGRDERSKRATFKADAKYIIDKAIDAFKIIVDVLGLVVVYRMFSEGIQFEQTGTFTSYTLKTLIGKMFRL